MLPFIPVTLDFYRTVKRHLHWTLQNLVAFADHGGKCWPSVRTLAAATGTPKSTVSRHLAQLAAEGIITRQRRPGGCYAYTIAKAFLPAQRGVSHRREKGVPPPRTEEQVAKETGARGARFAVSPSGGSNARFAVFRAKENSFGELLDERVKWEARLRSWRQSRFWLPLWGPRPDQPGCFAPL